jgi:Helix-turn-helix of DDE superfamily endonuclease
MKFLDFTSLTLEEFGHLVPVFEKNYQERMKYLRLDGKPRNGRGYQTYSNCPLPTPEDRLFFILVYVKTNNLQVIQGELFGMPQNKANQWIHTLLPVLQVTMHDLGDTPARSMEELAQRLNQHVITESPNFTPDTSTTTPDTFPPTSNTLDTAVDQEKQENTSSPLFVMMERNDVYSGQKTKMNRKITIAERKRVTR